LTFDELGAGREEFALDGIEPEGCADAGEAASMDGQCAEFLQETAMLRRRVAFV
jgi:hypothetical protein